MEPNNPIKSFDISSHEWLKELQLHGVVVLKSVLSNEEVHKGISLFWDWLQGLNSGLNRNDSKTWKNPAWPGVPDLGFFTGYGGAHSQASWFVRTRPKVKEAFSKIWETSDLLVSFDTFIAWRPWWHNPSWKPYVENLHCDQNPSMKKGFHCVQGMIPLYRVDEVGGLMVVPDTNNDQTQQELSKRYPWVAETNSDWLELSSKDPFMNKGILVKCEAGDMILWDSRVIHGGLIKQPTEEFQNQKNPNELVRLSMTVTMTPKNLASQMVLEKRRKAFQNRAALNHWPHEYHVSGMNIIAKDISAANLKYPEIEMTEEVKSLIG